MRVRSILCVCIVLFITFFTLITEAFANDLQSSEINNWSVVYQRTEYFVDFEGPGEVKTSYASGNVMLSGKDWNLDNVLIGTADGDRKFGERSARLRHQTALAATMTMLEDKDNGLGTLSFYYARSGFSQDNQPTAPVFLVEYSIDQGSSWIQIGNDINLDGIDQLTLFSQTVNIEGNVRIRFRSLSGSDGRRFNIDDILLTDFGDPDAVAPPTFSPPGGTYYGAVSVTISTTTPDATIHYTTDGTDPTQSSPIFSDPIDVDESMTIKARGYADDLEPSIISTAVYTINYPVEVFDVATLKSSPQDGTVYTLSNEVILTFQQTFRNQKFIQDNTAGILIDDLSGVITTTYQVGDGISGLTGTLNTYGNMIQLTPIQNPDPATSNNNPIIPITITMADFIDDIMDYQSRVVKINNVHFTTADGSATFANGQVYPISDGIETINFRTTFYDVDYITTIIPTEVISLRGIPNSRAEGHFFTARSLADFLPATGDIELLIQPEYANFGDVIVNEASTPVNFTVTNDGTVNVTIESLSLVGNNIQDFLLDDQNQYPLVLLPDDTFSFAAVFAPLSTGAKQAIIEIEATDNVTSVSYEIMLTGTGVLLLPPTHLTAGIIYWHDVELTWYVPFLRANDGNRNLLGFDVYRNGVLISPETPLPPTVTSYIDGNVSAGEYDYYVSAIYSVGSAPSESVDMEIFGPIDPVVMTPEPGEYVGQVEVTLTLDPWSDEIFYYTLDGTDPTDESLLYDSPILITEDTMIKAKAFKVGWESSVVTTGEYTILVSADDNTLQPLTTMLKQNRPNPFNPDTVIGFTLKESDRVRIDIYNIKGELINTPVDGYLSSGEYNIVWEGLDKSGKQMPSGVYFYRMSTDSYDQIRKMLLLK
ncbi:MAG: chitobiase/beta-hexosaminidase C-terminal domain-containing protein [Candidatus Cloacimonetes bacterium]|nr:chitobiase/beta-hexosaminidase C-terminal domain-containing protein [Candidatus Cloacimonadota bacterium]